jgi:hypothetical protein
MPADHGARSAGEPFPTNASGPAEATWPALADGNVLSVPITSLAKRLGAATAPAPADSGLVGGPGLELWWAWR